jgi:hypothetical protein
MQSPLPILKDTQQTRFCPQTNWARGLVSARPPVTPTILSLTPGLFARENIGEGDVACHINNL